MRVLSYWVLPILSGLVWLGSLLGLLLYWVVNTDEEQYSFMAAGQSIVYISDVAAGSVKPLFITAAVITSALLDVSFGLDIWLRRHGRLAPRQTTGEQVLQWLSICFAVVGTVGIICLSIFDTNHYKRAHDVLLCLFILGYLFSAVFLCWEFQRLGIQYREYRVLRFSFWLKLAFVLLEVSLVIVWGAMAKTSHYNAAAVIEWVIAFSFSFYIFSFAFDLWPAVRTRDPEDRIAGKENVPASDVH